MYEIFYSEPPYGFSIRGIPYDIETRYDNDLPDYDDEDEEEDEEGEEEEEEEKEEEEEE